MGTKISYETRSYGVKKTLPHHGPTVNMAHIRKTKKYNNMFNYKPR